MLGYDLIRHVSEVDIAHTIARVLGMYSPEIISQPVKSCESSSGHEVEQAKDPSDHSPEAGRRIIKRNSKGY